MEKSADMCTKLPNNALEERLRWVLPIVNKEIKLIDAVKLFPGKKMKIDTRTIGKILKNEGLVRKYRVRKLKYKYVKVPLAKGDLAEVDI